MSNPGPEQVLAAARASLQRTLTFDEFLAKLSQKDRVNAERRVTALEAEPAPHDARPWQRLACTMATLAPHAAKFVGRSTVQFYIADGKYRMQVFALEDLQDGNMTAYCPDVLAETMQAGLLVQPSFAGDQIYMIRSTNEPLRIDSLDGSSVNPAPHFKDMMGWNRKALRITLPPVASPSQVEATELICAMAAQHFVSVPAISRATKPQNSGA